MSIKTTAEPFSVAVPSDEGYREFYTRDGGFSLNTNGQLVTKQGYYVLGQNGVIRLNGDQFTVESDGTIIQNGQTIDRLQIRQFSNPDTLRKNGENLLSPTEETAEENFTGQVVQCYIEQSNVDSIREMVDMISLLRSYEANQRIITAMDGTLEKPLMKWEECKQKLLMAECLRIIYSLLVKLQAKVERMIKYDESALDGRLRDEGNAVQCGYYFK